MKWIFVIVLVMVAMMTAAYVSRTMANEVQQKILKPNAGQK